MGILDSNAADETALKLEDRTSIPNVILLGFKQFFGQGAAVSWWQPAAASASAE